MHTSTLRNPSTGPGPQTEPMPSLSATNQHGRYVYQDTPHSYVVVPGRYYPVLTPHGRTPVTREIANAHCLGCAAGMPPARSVPIVPQDPGFVRGPKDPSGVWGNVIAPQTAPLPDTSLAHLSPEGDLYARPDLPHWYTGTPEISGLRGF